MSGCRGPVAANDDKPRIRVRFLPPASPLLEHVERGIEEEGVYWAVERGEGEDLTAVAFEAAKASKLRVGVGVCPDGRLVLHHARIPDDDPLFSVEAESADAARAVGTNAARLAKRLPFRPIPGAEAPTSG